MLVWFEAIIILALIETIHCNIKTINEGSIEICNCKEKLSRIIILQYSKEAQYTKECRYKIVRIK